jgi:hypothetical protein
VEYPVLITEKRFSITHQSFWHGLLPMATQYIRRKNLDLERFATPIDGGDVDYRGVVNEAAFRVFEFAASHAKGIDQLSRPEIGSCIASAAAFINRFRAHDREEVLIPRESDHTEILSLARRLSNFFESESEAINIRPSFPGCGWVDECEGDAASDSCLYEVKAGDRQFQATDLRQTLCYAALAHASGRLVPSIICLVNPRWGVSLRENLETLCAETAAATSFEVLSSIASYISEPQWEERF